MLVLTRKLGETIVIDGGITISVAKIERGRVRLGVQAPDNIRISRGEFGDLRELRVEDLAFGSRKYSIDRDRQLMLWS